MNKRIYLNDLYDYYGELFTEKQKEYFENYYYDNLSLQEIAENNNISRNAVHNQLKTVEEKLYELEKVLKLYEKKKRIIELVENDLSIEKMEKLKELL